MFRAVGLGVAWGWLPCGMVYAVLLAALATAAPRMGALVMLAFGLGTLPNLLAIAFLLEWLRKFTARSPVRVTIGLLIAGVGLASMIKAVQPAVSENSMVSGKSGANGQSPVTHEHRVMRGVLP